MLSQNSKRCFPFLLAVLIVFSLMPVSAWAAEEGTHEHSLENAQSTVTPDTSSGEYVPSSAVAGYQALADNILNFYLGSTSMTDEQLQAAVAEMNPETCYEAYCEIVSLDVELGYAYDDDFLTDADIEHFLAANTLLKDFSDSIHEKAMQGAPNISFLATTVYPIDGVSVTDSVGNGFNSSGTVTIKAVGSLFSAAENNITIKNESSNTATLSFDYSVSYANSFTIAGIENTNSQGSYSVLLDKYATLEIKLTSNRGFSNRTATLTLGNFNLVEAASTSNVTIEYESSLGSVTAAGSAVTSGSKVQNVSLTDGVALVATPVSGATFLGWIDKSNRDLLSTSASYTYKPAGDSTVIAAFVKADAKAWFKVGTKYYDDLNAAGAAAISGNGVVILAADGTLPEDDYTIPFGVTLLIPYDSSNTLCTTEPTVVTNGTTFINLTTESYVKPTVYRTLTMASGANITVNGAMSLSGKSNATQTNNGSPSGPLSFVNMKSGSKITVNNGASLYAWGYIIGSGTVTIKSGGKVYEDFQVRDWRGGTAASAMLNKDQRVFPVSQYYVQNVEVPMTLEAGALEYCYMSLVATKVFGETTVPFVGESGMFRNSGTIVKDYNESTDRLEVTVDGDLTMSNLNLEISSYNMNSENYVLPITNNLTITVKSGTTVISQDMCMLPGSEITVAEGANVELASGISFFVYDLEEWSGKYFVYPTLDVSQLKYVGAKKGAPATRSLADAKIVVNGTFDAFAGYLYTTDAGANITSDGDGQVITGTPGTDTSAYQATQNGTTITFVEIPITPAKLKHGDGKYLASGTNTYVYNNETDRWECSIEHSGTGHTEVTDAMVPPTFDAAGLTAGSHCSVCGNVITAQEEIPVLSGMSVNIAVNDSLDIHFYLTDDVIKEIQGYYPKAAISATITRYWLDGENKGKSEELAFTYEDGEWTDGADSDRFSYTNIAAKEMTDTMKVVIFAGDKVLKTLENYSVKAYAMKVLQNTSGQSELTTALVDMLNYGAAAQSHFGYNQSTLANADLTVEQQGYATKSVTPKDTYSSESQAAAASVSAKNNLMYTFYFDLSRYTEDQRSGAKAAISYSHYTNSAVSENVEFASFYKFNDRLYGVDVKGMYIADGRQKVTCTLSIGNDAGEKDTLSATDSIEGYIARATSGDDVYLMLMKFIDSAHAYFS